MSTTQERSLVLADYDAKRYNVLLPTQSVEQIGPWHALRVSQVQADPSPNGGDVFKVGSRNDGGTWIDLYSPAKPLLMRIAAAAGIVWNWRDTGPESVSGTYVLYKAVGAIRLPDGTWQPIVCRKEIDLAVIEDEVRDANRARLGKMRADERQKIGDQEAWVAEKTRAEMIQWRKNKLMKAETGAMLRVIRTALGLRSQYTAAEISKPFVIPRIDFSPDYSDPEVKRVMLAQGAVATGSLFGQPLALASGAGAAEAFREPAAFTRQDDDPEDRAATGGPDEGAGALRASAEVFEAQPVGADYAPAGEVRQAELLPPEGVDPETGEKIDHGVACSEDGCGAKLAEGVATYSTNKFGRPLCFKHQPRARAGARA